jgi:altronate dehydratase small subunit
MSHSLGQGANSLVMNEKDHVATVLQDMKPGDSLHFRRGEQLETIVLQDPIPFGHKVAIVSMKQGSEVFKYGEIIGKTIKEIQQGEHVHVHNIEGTRGRGDLKGAIK